MFVVMQQMPQAAVTSTPTHIVATQECSGSWIYFAYFFQFRLERINLSLKSLNPDSYCQQDLLTSGTCPRERRTVAANPKPGQ